MECSWRLCPDTRDVGRDLVSRGQTDARDLPQRGVRLLRCGGVDTRADATALRRPLERRALGLGLRALAPISDKLLDRRHRSLVCTLSLSNTGTAQSPGPRAQITRRSAITRRIGVPPPGVRNRGAPGCPPYRGATDKATGHTHGVSTFGPSEARPSTPGDGCSPRLSYGAEARPKARCTLLWPMAISRNPDDQTTREGSMSVRVPRRSAIAIDHRDRGRLRALAYRSRRSRSSPRDHCRPSGRPSTWPSRRRARLARSDTTLLRLHGNAADPDHGAVRRRPDRELRGRASTGLRATSPSVTGRPHPLTIRTRVRSYRAVPRDPDGLDRGLDPSKRPGRARPADVQGRVRRRLDAGPGRTHPRPPAGAGRRRGAAGPPALTR